MRPLGTNCICILYIWAVRTDQVQSKSDKKKKKKKKKKNQELTKRARQKHLQSLQKNHPQLLGGGGVVEGCVNKVPTI